MCEFTFTNLTRGQTYAKRGDPILYQNIDRGTTRHMMNVVAAVIRLNGWSPKDYITWECCCEKYFYKDGELVHYYQPLEYRQDGCYLAECIVCKGENLKGFQWKPSEWLARQLYNAKSLSAIYLK